MRGEVNKALEAARGEKRIGGSLQAELTLFAKPELAKRLNALADELRFVLLTSKAKVVVADSAPEGAVATERDDLWLCVTQSAAAKCDRCWHHVEDVGTIAGHEEIQAAASPTSRVTAKRVNLPDEHDSRHSKTGLRWLWLAVLAFVLDQASKLAVVKLLPFGYPGWRSPLLQPGTCLQQGRSVQLPGRSGAGSAGSSRSWRLPSVAC